MEGGAATAMEVLLQNLINVLKEEFSLIRGLDEAAQQLQSTLETIQGFLIDAENKYITQHAVKKWLKDLEKLAFDADNVLDELSYHALHNEVKAIKTMKHKALSCFSSFDHTARSRRIAHKIKEINTFFDSINKKATDLHLQTAFAGAPAVPAAAFETDPYTLDPIFIGRDDDVPRLVDVMTLTGNLEERMFSILAVVGMGGMGKTTLTRKVFNDEKMKTQFGCHSWVYVSQTFDPLIILKKFLASLPSKTDEPSSSREAISLKLKKSFKAETDEIETRQGILKKLMEALKNKTYLLVLDDVWIEDRTKWTDFINALSGVTSTNGNGIIITTRSTEVASVVNPLKTHHLRGLSEEECWSIIKAKAFGRGNVFPSEFETVGRKISRRCQGLPLAAMVVGGVLRDKSEHQWLSIERNWVEGDSISRILRLSYHNLSSPSLRKCFSYCSIFPEGYRMEKQELIELWMAEGFLQPDVGNDMESLGDKFINVLVCNSLLQVAPRNDDDDVVEEFFTMHDLVHDLATSVLGSFQVQYMMQDDESSHIPKKTAKYLRALFLQGNITEFKLSNFNCLHVLSFGENQKLLSSSIAKLIHLRRLDISKTIIEYLPDSIGELHHLQTLRANARFLRELPRTLKYLISLRHLYMNNRVKLPPEIGRLTSLRTLTHFTVGHENGCRIEELGSLTNLKGNLHISYLENVQGKEDAKKASIFQNPNLVGLMFKWNNGRREGETNDENVLEGLQPHPNARKLEIDGFRGKRLPLWTVKMAVGDEPGGSWVGLNNLVDITLSNCSECEEIPRLGQLPNLKRLYLRNLENVKSIKSSWYGIENNGVPQETMIVFPMLQRLVLDGMPNLREWAEVEFPEVKVFPRLEYLIIDGCNQLMSIPSHSSACLKQLRLRHLNQLEYLPDWLFQNLSNLVIQYCPNLKWIGNPRGSGAQAQQGTLRELRIRYCGGLIDLPHQLFDSWAPSLERLYLSNLSSLKNLPKVLECLTKSDCLKDLMINGVPKFMVAGSVKSWPFGSLEYLDIDASVEWSSENEVAIKQTVDGMLQGCTHSLKFLQLKGLEIWESLPLPIQNLTSLRGLELSNFGIEELPEWFGNLSSLKHLSLWDCKQLRRLNGNLSILEYLSIYDCPVLHIDSVWLSNNTYTTIYVEGRRINPPINYKDNRCLKLPCV